MKKTVKTCVRIVLILLTVLLLLWGIVFISSKFRYKRDKAFLEENGYYNPVSAGDYSVNVLPFGKENGRHRIIAMAGMGIPDSCITMRRMTAALEADNQVVFIDRPGYGVSDDTEQAMTVEHVVEAYRTALKNAGIAAPYVLMPHSIGDMFASYWESKYPDEIEAVVIISGTELQTVPAEQMRTEPDPQNLLYFRLDRAGLGGMGNLFLKHFLPEKDWLTDEEQRMEYALALMTYDSRALLSESELKDQNINAACDAIVTNDISKIYISTKYTTKKAVEADGILTEDVIAQMMSEREELRAMLGEQLKSGAITQETYEKLLPKLPENDAERRQMAMEDLLRYENDRIEAEVKPFIEKLGSCELIELPGDHLIYEQKPDACGQIIADFLAELDG